MIKESEYCSKIIKTHFNKPLVITKKDHKDFESSTKCWISKKEEREVKVKHHGHITGKYRGFAHQEWNLNLSLTKRISILFRNLENYDSHRNFQEIEKYNFKIVIPKTIGKYNALTLNILKRKASNKDLH